ncbi:MAG: gluconate:H+ symporter [Chitinophagales bacterium]
MDYTLLLAVFGAVALLLILILVFKMQAFLALLISSIAVGLLAGMSFEAIIENIKNGMGGTLGYVATVVGIGAIFGAILEHSGATERLSSFLLDKFGMENAPTALSISGFLIAIPVFFDVAFVILVPMLYALQKKSKKSLLFFAIPLLASLAVTHSFIPPTPGPIAVADIIKVSLGWVILFGFIVGIPTTIVAGLVFGKYISSKIYVEVPEAMSKPIPERTYQKEVSIGLILFLILTPIALILANTVADLMVKNGSIEAGFMPNLCQFIGHPFVALIISTLLALYLLGTRQGFSKSELQDVSTKALGPAGVIILITGAGGVFKQMLVESGAGVMIAQQMIEYNIVPILLAFLLALLVRVLQGSATVAMITAAGIIAPIMENFALSEPQLALIVLSIAAGATGFSHVNDSGFWLVNQYLGLSEAQTLRSWTAMTGILCLTALTIIFVLSFVVA